MALEDRISAYADAMVTVARAEGTVGIVSDELFRVSQALTSSDELRMTLTDPRIPASRRQQIVEDILGGRANPTTTAMVSMIVGAGRAGDLESIVHEAIQKAATATDKVVAEVHTPIELEADQQERLTAALREAVGQDVDVKVVVDPTVLGGIVTTIGDRVIDGSVRTRLNQLREVL